MIETTTAFREFVMPEDAGACKANILATIDAATLTVRLSMFGFTDGDIASALMRAYDRGVEVWLLLDHLQSLGHVEAALLHSMMLQGFPPDHMCITTSTKHQFMHTKMLVVDAESTTPDQLFPTVDAAREAHYPMTLQGSLNFSPTALKQDNIWIVMPGRLVAAEFVRVFCAHWQWTMAHEAAYQVAA